MQFWQAKLAKERQKKFEAVLTALPELEKKGVYKVYKVSLNAPFGRIYGFLSIPEKAKNKKVPAEMTTCYAGPGWNGPIWCSPENVVLSMNIHTFDPADRDQAYEKLNASVRDRYKNRDTYMFIGLPDPDKLYYIHGIIGNVRALDWLASLPEVDAKHIGYFGTSQGGFFGLVLGALSDKLSAIVCDVPALCDNSSYLANRDTGFPWYSHFGGKTESTRKAVSYIDGANFARYVKTPIRIVTGEYDTTCYPHTVRIAYNRIPLSTDKQMFTQWGGSHTKVKIIYAELQRWMREKLGMTFPEDFPAVKAPDAEPQYVWNFDAIDAEGRFISSGAAFRQAALSFGKFGQGKGIHGSGALLCEDETLPFGPVPIGYDNYTIEFKFKLDLPFEPGKSRGLFNYELWSWSRKCFRIRIDKQGRLEVFEQLTYAKKGQPPKLRFVMTSEPLQWETGKWYTLILAVKKRQRAKLCLNGKTVAMEDNVPGLGDIDDGAGTEYDHRLRLGWDSTWLKQGYGNLHGVMDEVKIWNTVDEASYHSTPQ